MAKGLGLVYRVCNLPARTLGTSNAIIYIYISLIPMGGYMQLDLLDLIYLSWLNVLP